MRKARAAYYCYSAGFRVSVHDSAEEAISKSRVVLLSHGQVFQSGNGCTILRIARMFLMWQEYVVCLLIHHNSMS